MEKNCLVKVSVEPHNMTRPGHFLPSDTQMPRKKFLPLLASATEISAETQNLLKDYEDNFAKKPNNFQLV